MVKSITGIGLVAWEEFRIVVLAGLLFSRIELEVKVFAACVFCWDNDDDVFGWAVLLLDDVVSGVTGCSN